jgi:hypothetical protein
MYIQMTENILANGSTVPAMPTGRRQAGMIKALSFLACLSAGLSIYRQKEESGIQNKCEVLNFKSKVTESRYT